MQASPVTPLRTSGPAIEPHTAIPVALDESIDSGRIKQGQDVKAHLSAPVSVHGGPTLPAGTPVELNVIAAVPAGRMMAQGELSLQVLRVGKLGVFTNTLVFDGQPGHQDLPDSAPALGTDAGLASGTALTFHVQPAPSDNVTQVADAEHAPGSVRGIAPGEAPPSSSLKSTYGDPNAAPEDPAAKQNSVTPTDTTTNQGVQNLGQAGPAPNQPQSPAGRTPR